MRRHPGRRSLRRPRAAARMLAALLVAAAALAAAGCGENDTGGGGRVIGDTLTVVSLLPLGGQDAPAARQMVRGQKLALAEAGGRAGAYAVTFSSVDEGGADPAQRREDVAAATRSVLSDTQAIAVIGSLDYEAAAITVPLLNAAGLLHVSPTVGYPGFTRAVGRFEPERWYPRGMRSFVPIGGSDSDQAAIMAAAATGAAEGGGARVAVESGPGEAEEALATLVAGAVEEAGGELVGAADSADAVVYAGDDEDTAAALAESLPREAPGARLVLGDDLARTDLPRRLAEQGARRVLFVSRAPQPRSTPALREFEAAFEEAYGRAPGPYAWLGYEAMRSVLRHGIAAAGDEAAERDAVIAAYREAEPPSPSWSAFELTPSGRRWLDVGGED